MKNTKVLILGGTRFIGPKLIENLLKSDYSISIFNRGNNYGYKLPEQIEHINGNRHNIEDLKQLTNKDFDIIYDMCCYNLNEAKLLTETIKTNAQIVFFSTAAVYRKTKIFPIKEEASLGEWSSFGDYGRNKAEVERYYNQYALDNNLKLTIFRPPYLLGENNYFDRENYYFSRILSNDPIILPGNGKALLQFCFLDEVALAFANIPFIQTEQIEILNIGNDQYISLKDFIELCSEIANKKANILEVDMSRYEYDEEQFYDDLYPFPNLTMILSNEKIKNRYKIEFYDLEEGLRRIFKKWKYKWDGKVVKSESENQLLKKLQ